MPLKLLVVLHVLGASIWVGGHLILLLRYLPQALKEKNPQIIIDFEERFEKLGIPALLIQVITGVLMGLYYKAHWFSFHTHIDKIFNLKLLLLAGTIVLAIHARFFIIPKLNNHNMEQLAYHIAIVSLLAVGFVYLGISFRMV